MAPGPPDDRHNRFALLQNSPPNKRKKPANNKAFKPFPDLPQINNPDHKFIVISSNGVNKPLSHYSCFAIQKSLNLISKDIISVSELRDGNLLLLVKDKASAEKFIASKELTGICPIKASYHENLNFSKGTIYAPYLSNISEEEIVSELKSQGVVSVFKFKRTNDGVSNPTGVVLLTFDRYSLPEKIDIAWHVVKVREYIPNPMRCKKCQRLGHTVKHCSNAEVCPQCSYPPHTPENCLRTFCANCAGEHAASSNVCPKYNEAKEILKIKIRSKCTLREATKTYKSQGPSFSSSSPSFASVLSSNNSDNKNNTIPVNSINSTISHTHQPETNPSKTPTTITSSSLYNNKSPSFATVLSSNNTYKKSNNSSNSTATLTHHQEINPLKTPTTTSIKNTTLSHPPKKTINFNNTNTESIVNSPIESTDPLTRPNTSSIQSCSSSSFYNFINSLDNILPDSLRNSLESNNTVNMCDSSDLEM